jgi:hypothetical protein
MRHDAQSLGRARSIAHHRRAGDDFDAGNPLSDRAHDLLVKTVGEECILRIGAQILERHHGKPWLANRDDGGWRDEPSIVGMWRFELVTGPTGAVVVDDGYAQWHSDGTEIQNSGLHAPITSNFCLGVWKRVGRSTYQLNHFPLAWDSTGQSPANAIQLTETVHLTDDDHMTGTFTLKVYVWTSTDSLNVAPGGPVATVKGTINATRVTIDSTVPVAP